MTNLNSCKHSSQTQMPSIDTLTHSFHVSREFSIDPPSASSFDSSPAASVGSKRVQRDLYREPQKNGVSTELWRHDSLFALVAEDKASPRAALSDDEHVEEWGRGEKSNGTPIFSNETSAPESWASRAFDSLLDRYLHDISCLSVSICLRACVRACVGLCVCVYV